MKPLLHSLQRWPGVLHPQGVHSPELSSVAELGELGGNFAAKRVKYALRSGSFR